MAGPGAGAEPTLMNINLELQTGGLMVVVGAVGAGKSSLLAALLGEMSGSSGAASVAGKIAQPQPAAVLGCRAAVSLPCFNRIQNLSKSHGLRCACYVPSRSCP